MTVGRQDCQKSRYFARVCTRENLENRTGEALMGPGERIFLQSFVPRPAGSTFNERGNSEICVKPRARCISNPFRTTERNIIDYSPRLTPLGSAVFGTRVSVVWENDFRCAHRDCRIFQMRRPQHLPVSNATYASACICYWRVFRVGLEESCNWSLLRLHSGRERPQSSRRTGFRGLYRPGPQHRR